MEVKAYAGEYEGESAVWLKAGRYEAAIIPGVGGNLVAFRDTENGYRFLREPGADGIEVFKQSPGVFGIPVLFPPNRYEDGKFPWKGQVYQLPVNEIETGNHLHGFLHTIPWEVEDYGTGKNDSYVVVSVKIDENHPSYQYLPHQYTVKLRYSLSEDGLAQQILIRNDGTTEMPCLLAFHTAINAPFAEGSSPEDYKVKATIGSRWELGERMLPTGNFQPLSGQEEQLKGEGVNPYFEPLDNHYTAVPQNGRNLMELTDTKLGVTLVYDVGTSYKQWMIWNHKASGKFICPEPQLNLVNAPNVNLPADEIGLFGLQPGEYWEERARLYVK